MSTKVQLMSNGTPTETVKSLSGAVGKQRRGTHCTSANIDSFLAVCMVNSIRAVSHNSR